MSKKYMVAGICALLLLLSGFVLFKNTYDKGNKSMGSKVDDKYHDDDFDIWFDEKNTTSFDNSVGKFTITGFVKSRRAGAKIIKLEYAPFMCEGLTLGEASSGKKSKCAPITFRTLFNELKDENPVPFSLEVSGNYDFPGLERVFFRMTNDLGYTYSSLASGCDPSNTKCFHNEWSALFGIVEHTQGSKGQAITFYCTEGNGMYQAREGKCTKDSVNYEGTNTRNPEVDKNRTFAIWFDKNRTYITTGVAVRDKDGATVMTQTALSATVQANKGNIKAVRYAFSGCAFLGAGCESSRVTDYDKTLLSDILMEADKVDPRAIKHNASVNNEIFTEGELKYIESDYGVSAIVFRFEDSEGNILHPNPETLLTKPTAEPDPLYSVIVRHKDGKTFYSFPCSPSGDICTKEWKVIKNCPIDTDFPDTKQPTLECFLPVFGRP